MAKTIATNMPGAWIVNPKDKGRKSIKSANGHRSESITGKVYLKDQEEFEVELFNPLKVSVLADIKLNGQSISKTGLVINPGQRVYLDCFIDDRKKFIFKTYDVEQTEESLEAIQDNGLLEVFFYKEEVVAINNWNSRFNRLIIEKWYPTYYPVYPSYKPYNPYVGTPNIWFGTTANQNFTNSAINANSTTNSINISNSEINLTKRFEELNPQLYNSGTNFCNTNTNVAGSFTNMNINSIETGRVEKGKKSNQNFTEVDMDFERNYISSTIIQILPESRKPAEIKQVKGKFNDIEIKKDSNEIIELIKKLSELHKDGILTDDEFTSKKTELLSKI